jgi:LuxR family maltose regulon positive regulatory protein
VPRRRLIGRLRAARASVISLRAPAGYGKSTVLRQWAAADGRPFAWLDLDEADDDAVTLGSRLTAAIAGVQPTSAPLQAVTAGPTFSRVVLPALAQQLAAVTVPFVLVLDDVQLIGSRAATRLLTLLARSTPPGCRLVFAGRTGAPVPLARLRADAVDVCEIGPPDLELDRHETQLVLARCGLRPDAIDTVLDLTQGWPAGVALVAGILATRGLAGLDVVACGRDRSVAEYLREQVWSDLDDATLTFLTHAAVLPEPTGATCDAVLGSSGSGAVLRDLSRGNVLLRPLDEGDRRFAWHPLLRAALLSELDRRESGSAGWFGRAATALAADGDLTGAITAAVRAGNPAQAGPWIWRATGPAVGSGSPLSIAEWLRPLPDRVVATSVELSTAAAWSAFLGGDAADAERWTALAELGLDRPDGGAGVERRRGEVAVAIRLLAAVRTGAAAPTVRSLDRLDPVSPWQSLARWSAAVEALLAGDRDRADRLLRQAAALADVLRCPLAAALVHAVTAGVALRESRTADSVRAGAAALDALTSGGMDGAVLTALPYSVVAAVQAANGELPAARRSLGLARRLPADAGVAPWITVLCSVFQARACLVLGDLPMARSLLRHAGQAHATGPESGMLPELLDAARADLGRRCADGAGAAPALTAAEMRVLRFLPTQLSFPEIAGGIFLSRHTVKTQALAIYHKLGVSSRTAAVERARSIGLLPEPSVVH